MKNITKLRNLKNEEGFTLIELIVVVVIIGILAAISVPIFANQQKEAINASVKSDVANARSFIPGKMGKVKDLETFKEQVTVTDGNSSSYTITASGTDACYQVDHVFSPSEVTTYRYIASEGKVEKGNCSAFEAQPGATSIQVQAATNTPAAGGGSTVTPTPTPTATATPTPTPTATAGAGTPTGSTTNQYIDVKVGISNMNTDWQGRYTASVTVTPKQNRVTNFTISWTDPSVTGIQDTFGQLNCSVATGGVITCSSIPGHWSTQNLQYGNTFNGTVQLITTNKSTAPANPTVYITAN